MNKKHRIIVPTMAVLLALSASSIALAEDVTTPAISSESFTINNLWLMVCTFLVFTMHLGFACLECGLTQAKNTVNILFKNTAIVGIGLLTYALCGFNLMYPEQFSSLFGLTGVFGFDGWGIGLSEGTDATSAVAGQPWTYADGGFTYWTDFLFQGMFAATAATIVSGAVAERVKLSSFLLFSTIYVAFVYPVLGSWVWGEGWLNTLGFHDFAGSTLVHSVGGWAALAGVIVTGPRIGKYVDNKIKPVMGHSLPLACIGAFLLWLGWFGFNGGSVLNADPIVTSYVLVTTCLAAAAGIWGAIVASWQMQSKPDLTMALNGALAGLVSITAGANVVSISAAVLIGLLGGALVVASVIVIDRLKLDDPVGAISVHLVCGIWGTLAVGIFSSEFSILTQLLGIVAYGIPAFTSSLALFQVLKMTVGIRVSDEEEITGLDIHEHGMEAYAGLRFLSAPN